MDEDEKVGRAIDRRSRPHRGPFEFGDYVYHCRKYPRDGSVGRWYGPRVIIGKHGDSRLWVAVGTKVLKSALEQLRKTTVDQEAAIRMVSPDLVSRKRGSQGSQVYTDISNERFPPNYVDEPIEGINAGAAGHGAGKADRKRKLDQTSAEESDEMADYEPSPNKQPWNQFLKKIGMEVKAWRLGSPSSQAPEMHLVSSRRASNATVPDEPEAATWSDAPATYGPVGRQPSRQSSPREGPHRPEASTSSQTDLQRALHRSVEVLDLGQTRISRTLLAIPVPDEDDEDVLRPSW